MTDTKQAQFPKELYFPSAKTPSVVRVPKMSFIVVEGKGAPSTSQQFQDAIAALYGAAYTMKFMFEKGHPVRDARIGPLEGLFWTGQCAGRFEMDSGAEQLLWKLMLVQPRGVTKKTVEAALSRLKDKKGELPGLNRLRFESYAEGRVVQVMHIGPYGEEAPTITRLLEFAEEQGFEAVGPHHEIYHSDPRRTKPDKLKTVIRYPVVPKKRRTGRTRGQLVPNGVYFYRLDAPGFKDVKKTVVMK